MRHPEQNWPARVTIVRATGLYMFVRSYTTTLRLLLFFSLFLLEAARECSQAASSVTVMHTFTAYTRKVAHDPHLYPAYVQLVSAYLEKACDTHNRDYLKKARSVLQRSMEIQPNFRGVQDDEG